MPRIWKTLAAVGTLAVALTVWGCEQATGPSDQSPQIEAEARAVPGPIAGMNSVASTAAQRAHDRVSAVVGPRGGVLEVGGHVLTIPRGSVRGATVFTITTVPHGGVEVELQATSPGVRNRPNDVGSRGFAQPVRLVLSYAHTDAGDPEDLVIVRVDDGEPQETHVSKDRGSTVWAALDRFSRYRLVSN